MKRDRHTRDEATAGRFDQLHNTEPADYDHDEPHYPETVTPWIADMVNRSLRKAEEERARARSYALETIRERRAG